MYCVVEWRSVIKQQWNEIVVILMKFASLSALEVVKMTTPSAVSDENVVKMTTFSFCEMWTVNLLRGMPYNRLE